MINRHKYKESTNKNGHHIRQMVLSTIGTCRAGSSHIPHICYQQSIAKLSKKFSLAWQSSQWKAWWCPTYPTDRCSEAQGTRRTRRSRRPEGQSSPTNVFSWKLELEKKNPFKNEWVYLSPRLRLKKSTKHGSTRSSWKTSGSVIFLLWCMSRKICI